MAEISYFLKSNFGKTNNLSEKLIEQYEERIKELKDIISELRKKN